MISNEEISDNSGTQTSATGPRRRRFINRPSGTFARFLDALLSYDFRYFDRQQHHDFTSYKQDLAKVELGISPRQLARFLSGQALPELRLLRRLSDRFSQISVEGWIPMLGWKPVAKEIDLLPEHSVVTIFAGHLSAEQISGTPPGTIKEIASSIGKQHLRYVWVVPPISDLLRTDELQPNQVVERLRLRVLTAWLDANPEATRDATIESDIAKRVMIFQTGDSVEAAHFWSRLPRYVMTSNLLAEPHSEFAGNQFSAALVSACVPYPEIRQSVSDHIPEPLSTGGWSYLPASDDQQIREMFSKMEKKGYIQDAEHRHRSFPKPGRDSHA